jgi:hypothetical protein
MSRTSRTTRVDALRRFSQQSLSQMGDSFLFVCLFVSDSMLRRRKKHLRQLYSLRESAPKEMPLRFCLLLLLLCRQKNGGIAAVVFENESFCFNTTPQRLLFFFLQPLCWSSAVLLLGSFTVAERNGLSLFTLRFFFFFAFLDRQLSHLCHCRWRC